MADQFQEDEAALLAEYWSILRSDQPVEWIEDDKRAFLGKLAKHRDRMADVLVIGEEQETDSLAWEPMLEAYQALDAYLSKRGLPQRPAASRPGAGR